MKFALLATIITLALITVQVTSHGGRPPQKLLHGTKVSDIGNLMPEKLETPHSSRF